MVRSIVSAAVAALLIIFGGIAENIYLTKTFDNLTKTFTRLEEDILNETCDEKEVDDAQSLWLGEKQKLHAFIPHSDIKEVDLWVSETVAYVRLKNYEEAADKVQVILDLFRQIPRTFSIRIENLL